TTGRASPWNAWASQAWVRGTSSPTPGTAHPRRHEHSGPAAFINGDLGRCERFVLRPGTLQSVTSTVANAERLEQILGMLRDRGGRVTTSRRAIISSLLRSGGHVTADELTADIQANFPDIHLSTI